ncbi:hypothetical protein IC3_00038 [Bacillus cereus VD142]|nr:hypothetical protein IC3_00038 [Bacillus cereus VD142]
MNCYAMKQCVFHKKERDLYEEIVIGLYLRIDTCIRHHPKDLEDWRYWMNEIMFDSENKTTL